MEDNCEYEIVLENVVAEDEGVEPLNTTVTVLSALSPMYATTESVLTLVEDLNLEERVVLFYIRNASRHVEYIGKKSFVSESVIRTDHSHERTRFEKTLQYIPYPASEYVRYRAAYDSVLRIYMSLANNAGRAGAIGKVNFEEKMPNLTPLLNALKEQIAYWEKAVISGEGAKPQSAVKSGGSVRRFPSRYLPQPDITPIHKNPGRGFF